MAQFAFHGRAAGPVSNDQARTLAVLAEAFRAACEAAGLDVRGGGADVRLDTEPAAVEAADDAAVELARVTDVAEAEAKVAAVEAAKVTKAEKIAKRKSDAEADAAAKAKAVEAPAPAPVKAPKVKTAKAKPVKVAKVAARAKVAKKKR